MYSEEGNIKTISVNVSNYSYPFINMDELQLQQDRINIFMESDEFQASLIQARFGKELWNLFIILVLILIVLEIYVIKKIEGNNFSNISLKRD